MISSPTLSPSFGPPIALELLDPYTCIITQIPIKLDQTILQTHELVPSFKHNGYATKLKMLNSLKRCLEEFGLALVELPNSAFKMFKVVQGSSGGNAKRIQFNEANRSKKLMKGNNGNSINNTKTITMKNHANSLLSVGRWILTAHQKQTVEYFLKRGHRMVIADTWNMGKTVTSLACAQLRESKRILVVVPKQLICHWAWHIGQICFSLSSSRSGKKFNPKFPSKQVYKHQTYLKIIDFQQSSHNENLQTSQFRQLVKKREKAQVKFKTEEGRGQDVVVYSLCSYEYLNNNDHHPRESTYDCLILDQPQLYWHNDQTNRQNRNEEQNGSHRKIRRQQLKKWQKIESMIICKQTDIESTRSLLPYLNGKVSEEEIERRYGREGEQLRNPNEYSHSIWKYYYHVNGHLSASHPGPIIKNVLVGSYDDSENIVSIGKLREQVVLSYVQYTIGRRDKYQYYLIFNEQNLMGWFYKKLQELGINSNILPSNGSSFVYIGTMAQTLGHLSYSSPHPQTTMSIICQPTNSNTNSNINLQSQMEQLYKYSNIEYLEHCTIHRTYLTNNPKLATYEVDRRQMKDTNIMMPHVDSRAYVERMMMEGEYISSGDEQTPKRKDPEHYEESHSSITDNNRMVDESEEIRQLWKPNQTGNHDQPNDNVSVHQMEMCMEDNEIEILDSQSCQIGNVKPNNAYVNTSEKQGGNVIEICLDSEHEQSNRAIPNQQQLQLKQQQQNITPPELISPQHGPSLPFHVQLFPRTRKSQIQIQATTNTTHTQQMIEAEASKTIAPTISSTVPTSMDETITSNAVTSRRGRKRKVVANQSTTKDWSQTQPTRMTTRRSSKNKQEESKKKEKKPQIREIEQKQEQQKQDEMGEVEEISRLGAPHRQFIEIGSDSSCHTMAVTPKKTKITKCRSKQVLSIKLIPKLSQLSFETNPADQPPPCCD